MTPWWRTRRYAEAVRRAGRGSVDADLGGGVIKQRIARRDELRALRKMASEMFALDESGLEAMLANGTIGEVDCDG